MHNVLLSVYDVSLFQVQPATFALLKLVQLTGSPFQEVLHTVAKTTQTAKHLHAQGQLAR